MIAGCLAAAGHELVGSIADADVVVYNTCAVKAPTEDRAIEILGRVPENKKLIVAGCLPMVNFERLRAEVRFDAVTGPACGDRIVGIVNRVCEGDKVNDVKGSAVAMPRLNLPIRRLNSVVSGIPVNHGCLGSCSYCCVKNARGKLRSYTSAEVVERVRWDLKAGVKEFWLTSQDTAAYGRDFEADLSVLLRDVCRVPGDFKIRVGMMTPNLALDILIGLTSSFEDEHLFKFVHLPVQSGNDRILGAMRRSYTVSEFIRVVKAFRNAIPDMTVSTDVICGFPGEDAYAFENTLELLRTLRPDVVNTSRFFARPGTAAQRMRTGLVPFEEIKRRSTAVASLAREIARENNAKWVGWEGSVLVDEVGKVAGSWIGRNYAYKPVVVRSDRSLLGNFLRVRVVEAFDTYLLGEIVS